MRTSIAIAMLACATTLAAGCTTEQSPTEYLVDVTGIDGRSLTVEVTELDRDDARISAQVKIHGRDFDLELDVADTGESARILGDAIDYRYLLTGDGLLLSLADAGGARQAGVGDPVGEVDYDGATLLQAVMTDEIGLRDRADDEYLRRLCWKCDRPTSDGGCSDWRIGICEEAVVAD